MGEPFGSQQLEQEFDTPTGTNLKTQWMIMLLGRGWDVQARDPA